MARPTPNDIFQFSLLSAYTAGLKDGGPPIAFLATQGDHGIGMFDEEESELVQVDGVAYCIDTNGDVEEADEAGQLPFVMVTHFQPTQRVKTPPGTSSKKLKEVFEGTSKNTTMPFRLTGMFSYLNTRHNTFWGASGTIFGFCVPAWQKAMSGDGLQCCFVTDDRKHGGWVLDFETEKDVVLEWSKCGRFHLGFPKDEEFDELPL